ncbi:hypothetical protein LCL87_04990 [Rhodococcus hoagii]|nr:hypothetical protein [Prescottella equi]
MTEIEVVGNVVVGAGTAEVVTGWYDGATWAGSGDDCKGVTTDSTMGVVAGVLASSVRS